MLRGALQILVMIMRRTTFSSFVVCGKKRQTSSKKIKNVLGSTALVSNILTASNYWRHVKNSLIFLRLKRFALLIKREECSLDCDKYHRCSRSRPNECYGLLCRLHGVCGFLNHLNASVIFIATRSTEAQSSHRLKPFQLWDTIPCTKKIAWL